MYVVLNRDGLPWWLRGKESACNTGDMGRSLGWEDALENQVSTRSSIPDGEIPWTEEPGGATVPGVTKSRT